MKQKIGVKVSVAGFGFTKTLDYILVFALFLMNTLITKKKKVA